MKLRRGDVLRLVTGTGGGYGDLQERDPGLVRADLRDQVITSREAAEVYGIAEHVAQRVHDHGTWSVNITDQVP
jgi:N-methylhydantoinase B